MDTPNILGVFSVRLIFQWVKLSHLIILVHSYCFGNQFIICWCSTINNVVRKCKKLQIVPCSYSLVFVGHPKWISRQQIMVMVVKHLHFFLCCLQVPLGLLRGGVTLLSMQVDCWSSMQHLWPPPHAHVASGRIGLAQSHRLREAHHCHRRRGYKHQRWDLLPSACPFSGHVSSSHDYLGFVKMIPWWPCITLNGTPHLWCISFHPVSFCLALMRQVGLPCKETQPKGALW